MNRTTAAMIRQVKDFVRLRTLLSVKARIDLLSDREFKIPPSPLHVLHPNFQLNVKCLIDNVYERSPYDTN